MYKMYVFYDRSLISLLEFDVESISSVLCIYLIFPLLYTFQINSNNKPFILIYLYLDCKKYFEGQKLSKRCDL